MSALSRSIDRLKATFDHEGLVANAGLIVPATLIDRLGLEDLIDEHVDTGSSRPGRKILTVVAAILAGATHIDHVDMLRAGATERVLPFRPMAASTVGTFLRTFTFGHVRQLDAVAGRVLQRAWQTGAGPGGKPIVIDLDSTICEVHGKQKQGTRYGYTGVLGYHPLLATLAGTGEILFARMRHGSAHTARGAVRFVDELVAVTRRAGATGPVTMRADSGFWAWKLIDRLDAHKICWSITVRLHKHMKQAIAAIPDDDWIDIDYTIGGHAQVAETIYTTGKGKHARSVRLVVRRTRLTDRAQRQLWPDWRHHAFITNRNDLTTIEADQFHREHAVVELVIRDLKEGAGLEHLPSGNHHANAAWLACSVLAHNLGIWTTTIAELPRVTHRTRRTRIINLPAVIVNHAGIMLLRFPARWPWATQLDTMLDRVSRSSSTIRPTSRSGPSRPTPDYQRRQPNTPTLTASTRPGTTTTPTTRSPSTAHPTGSHTTIKSVYSGLASSNQLPWRGSVGFWTRNRLANPALPRAYGGRERLAVRPCLLHPQR